MRPKNGDIPPSKEETADFVKEIEAGQHTSAAMQSIGYSVHALRRILRRGRAGEPGFAQFVQAYEAAVGAQSRRFWAMVQTKIDEGDFNAAKYFHAKILAPREDEIQKALVSDEFEVKKGADGSANETTPQIDLDAIERRATLAIRLAASEDPQRVQ